MLRASSCRLCSRVVGFLIEAQGSKSLRQKWLIILTTKPRTGTATLGHSSHRPAQIPDSKKLQTSFNVPLGVTWDVGAGSGDTGQQFFTTNVSCGTLANFSPHYLHLIDAETEA